MPEPPPPEVIEVEVPVYVVDPDATPETVTLYRTRIVTETVEVPVHHTETIYIRCVVAGINAQMAADLASEAGVILCPE